MSTWRALKWVDHARVQLKARSIRYRPAPRWGSSLSTRLDTVLDLLHASALPLPQVQVPSATSGPSTFAPTTFQMMMNKVSSAFAYPAAEYDFFVELWGVGPSRAKRERRRKITSTRFDIEWGKGGKEMITDTVDGHCTVNTLEWNTSYRLTSPPPPDLSGSSLSIEPEAAPPKRVKQEDKDTDPTFDLAKGMERLRLSKDIRTTFSQFSSNSLGALVQSFYGFVSHSPTSAPTSPSSAPGSPAAPRDVENAKALASSFTASQMVYETSTSHNPPMKTPGPSSSARFYYETAIKGIKSRLGSDELSSERGERRGETFM